MSETEKRAKMTGKKLGKTIRAIRAVMSTGYDIETKIVLVAYAMELRFWRRDWCVWPGTRRIAAMTSLSRGTVIARRRRLVADGVLELLGRGEDGHDLNRTHFSGRPTDVYQFNIEKLEDLTREAISMREIDDLWWKTHPEESREEYERAKRNAKDPLAPGVNEEKTA